jgi:hypothetical protein
MHPAVTVHVTGRDARQCYDAIEEMTTFFVEGGFVL